MGTRAQRNSRVGSKKARCRSIERIIGQFSLRAIYCEKHKIQAEQSQSLAELCAARAREAITYLLIQQHVKCRT